MAKGLLSTKIGFMTLTLDNTAQALSVRPAVARRLQVMLVLPIGHLGGGPETVRLIAKHLDRQRFDVSVVCPDSPMMEKMSEIANLKRFSLQFPSVPSLASISRLARIFKQEQPDIVHSQLFHGDLYSWLASRKQPVPILATTLQGINFHWEMERGLRRFFGRFFSSSYRTLYRDFNGIAACSEAVRQAVASRPGVVVPSERIHVIHNTIDLHQTRLPTAEPVDAKRTAGVHRLITVANFDPVKGHGVLIEALRLLPKDLRWECVLIGDGPRRNNIARCVSTLGLSGRVRFLGFRNDVSAWIRSSDCFVFPSRWDGLGMAVLEAMALGVPVVASATGGIPEIIQQGITGLLVPPEDPSALSLGIRRVLNDEMLTGQLAAAAKADVEKHDVTNMSQAYALWYEALATGKIAA